MVLDTGASVLLMSQRSWERLFPELEFHPTSLRLKKYTGQGIGVVGQRNMRVKYGELPLIVSREMGQPYMEGTGWVNQTKLGNTGKKS